MAPPPLSEPTVAAADRRVVVLGGSDRRLVFGRAVDDGKVLVFVLGGGNWTLLPEDVGQRSAQRGGGGVGEWEGETHSDAIIYFAPLFTFIPRRIDVNTM